VSLYGYVSIVGNLLMAVRIHPHTRQRMHERGVPEEEVTATVEQVSSSQRSLDVSAFDVTSDLTENGVEGSIIPSRSKRMPCRKILIGWW
jgi:hypothetical protein